jgi:hypothetical protein
MVLAFLIVSSIVISTLLISIPAPGSELSLFFSNWTVNISAILAASLSCLRTVATYRVAHIQIIFNNRKNEYEDDTQLIPEKAMGHFYISISLTIGLALWTLAELIWTYYQLGLGIENPFPSAADALWLLGYPFIIYFTYGMNKVVSRNGIFDREALILLSVSAGLTLAYIFNLTFGVADIFSTAQDELGWLISIFYPILDTIALIPAILIMMSVNKSRDKSSSGIDWLLLAGSIVVVTVADIGFGYSEVIGRSEEEGWIWDTLYSTSYIVMAGALYLNWRLLYKSEKQALTDLRHQYNN